MPAMVMVHDVDPREAILDRLGKLDDLEIFNRQVLVAIYKRGGPSQEKEQMTAGGILIPGKTAGEDNYQSKVGLVIKLGESAFNDTSGLWFNGVTIELGDWVVFRVSDGLPMDIIGSPPRIDNKVNTISCRLLEDVRILGRIQHPDTVW
jgi:co-chaperonin GroES (HSP10)